MAYIRLHEAAEILGIAPESLCTAVRYKPFYRGRTKGVNEAYFDLTGYQKFEEIEYSLLEKTKLFLEYLVHEEGYTYTSIAQKTKVHVQALHQHKFSASKARIIAKWFAKYRPFSLSRFDEFYEWKPSNRLRVIAFKTYKDVAA